MALRTTLAIGLAAALLAPAAAFADHHKDRMHHRLKERVYVETSIARAGLGGKSIIDANYENNKQPVFLIHRRRPVGGQIKILKPGR